MNKLNKDSFTNQESMLVDNTIDLQVEQWSAPESLSNDSIEPTQYPIRAWPGKLRKVVEAIAFYTQVPTAMSGQCVLGSVAHIGQALIDAPMGHIHMPASLYLITEGSSGSGKSSAMRLSHNEIRAHQKKRYDIFVEKLEEWESQKSGLKGNDLKSYLHKNSRPLNPVNMFSDATIEPVLDRFLSKEMKNASFISDEAGQFFNGYTMSSDTAGNAMSALTTLWSDGTVDRLRSQKGENSITNSRAYDVRLGIFLMGQRVILEKALANPLLDGQGLLARSLFACPSSIQGHRVWNDLDRRQKDPYADPDLVGYWERCGHLLKLSSTNDSQNNEERIKMRWHDELAEQAFYDGMQAIEIRQANGEALEYLRAYASRLAENASRIASLIAFFDERETITSDDINRAFLLVEYSISERLRYFDSTPSGEQNNSEKLSSWLIDKAKNKQPTKLSYSYIYNGAPMPMRKDVRLLKTELSILENAGHIKQKKEGNKLVVYINPQLYS